MADRDLWHEVETAWMGEELLRDVYAPTVGLDAFLAWADEVDIIELTRSQARSEPGANGASFTTPTR